jgi:serine/threonine-protein kinase
MPPDSRRPTSEQTPSGPQGIHDEVPLLEPDPFERSDLGDPDSELDDADVEPLGDTYPSSIEHREHPFVGQVLADRFQIETVMGKGAHSLVFRAFDRKLGHPVALKVLRPELNVRLEEFTTRFRREAALARALHHPRIVTVYEFGILGAEEEPDDPDEPIVSVSDDDDLPSVERDDEPTGASRQGTCFIAMEILRGRNLKHLLKQQGPLRIEKALPVFHQVAQALRAAHEAGFLHRDIKPSNVFLDEATGEVKLLDFGLVKSSDDDQVELTDAGGFVGTPQYAAPEQLESTHAGPRTDVYALGILMFRTLTGVLPFVGSSVADLAAKHRDAPVPRMRDRNPEIDVPADLEAIVLRCMEKAPSRRYADMDELLEALEGAAALAGVRLPDVPAAPQPRATLRWLAPAALVAAVLSGLALVARWLTSPGP